MRLSANLDHVSRFGITNLVWLGHDMLKSVFTPIETSVIVRAKYTRTHDFLVHIYDANKSVTVCSLLLQDPYNVLVSNLH